jgi:hypothetical protein
MMGGDLDCRAGNRGAVARRIADIGIAAIAAGSTTTSAANTDIDSDLPTKRHAGSFGILSTAAARAIIAGISSSACSTASNGLDRPGAGPISRQRDRGCRRISANDDLRRPGNDSRESTISRARRRQHSDQKQERREKAAHGQRP